MKKISFVLILVLQANYFVAQSIVPLPQSVSSDQYDELKKQGKVSSGLYFMRGNQPTQALKSIIQPPITPQAPAANCNCMLTIDATYQVAPFTIGVAPDYRNDDGSTPVINLPFNFCFYGQTQNQVYINNNGNISFGSPYGTFSSATFPSALYTMIAPFWADIDTRNLLSGIVYYKITPSAMIIRWQTVGYYAQHADKLNDFQLIISDGIDPILPVGSNVAFCYGDMQWTTGDASLGVNGFGGVASTVGANMGDGINYIQIGTFDAPGLIYNGPFGLPSGISWLDNKQFFLDVCSTGGGGNLPPIMNASLVCDTLTICVGDTLPIIAQFLSPENNQTTTITGIASGTGLIALSSVPGNPGIYNGIFVGQSSNVGLNSILLAGTDNGVPAQTTTGNIIIIVIPGPTANFTSIGICPGAGMPFTNTSTSPNGPLVSYHWNFGITSLTNDTSNVNNPFYVYNTSGIYQVSLLVVDSIGCKDTVQQNVTVYNLPQVQFSAAPFIGCAPLCVNFQDLSTVQNSSPAQWLWQFGDGSTDTLQNPTYCYPLNGIYTVVLTTTSAQGCLFTDSIQNYINVIPGPQAAFTLSPQPVTIADATIYFQDASVPLPFAWNWDFGVVGGTSTLQNPIFVYPDTGFFTVMLIVSNANGSCPDTAYATLAVSPELLIWIPNAFTPNDDLKNDIFLPVFSDPSYIEYYDFKIFDRWGNLIFDTKNPLLGWDGSLNGVDVQIDSYVFRILVRGTDGLDHKYFGHVNLIK